MCGFAATRPINLKHHKENEHSSAVYPCDQCFYVATRPKKLQSHKNAKHYDKTFPCGQCKYVAARNAYLERHKASRHTENPKKRGGSNNKRGKQNIKRKIKHESDDYELSYYHDLKMRKEAGIGARSVRQGDNSLPEESNFGMEDKGEERADM